MENIIIIPENKKQFSAIKTFLEEMKIRFKTEKQDDTLMTEEEFYVKIDRSIKQAEEGKVVEYTPELEKKLFKSIL
mgnify:FL=1|jgi:Fe-S cluster assembly iron-binding protein IscA